MASSERIRAAEMLYARCVQPLDFWLDAMPTLPPMQIEGIMQRLGDLAAFDIDNPSGRFMLNLSRATDRFIAMRLQVSGEGGSAVTKGRAALQTLYAFQYLFYFSVYPVLHTSHPSL